VLVFWGENINTVKFNAEIFSPASKETGLEDFGQT
jgi:hypothetical protein